MRRREAPDGQLGLFAARFGPSPVGVGSCGEPPADQPSPGQQPVAARCRELMYARLVIAVNDANRPTKRLAGIFALVVEGPGGRPLAMVPDVCLLRLYRNVPQRHGRTRKLDRLASEAALDNALARLEREGWLRLVGRSKRREE